MEMRYGEYENAHEIYKRFLDVHPDEANWIKWARFEEKNRQPWMARNVLQSAVHYFGSDNPPPIILKELARFEERQGEHERVKAIYKYAMDMLPKDLSEDIYTSYHEYEKKYGDKCTIKESLSIKRKHYYEKKIEENPTDYDEWFCYLKMMEDESQDVDEIRNLYERAIANVPLIEKKIHWRRYIYLWIRYALFEEIQCDSPKRAEEIYKKCLEIIPSNRFTFSKIWIYLAEVYIRQRNFVAARKVLGNGIGRFKRNKLFRFYIKFETDMLEYDRTRRLYDSFILACPSYQQAWIEYANFEHRCRQFVRARAIFEKALLADLEMANYVWKNYIEFELSIGEFPNAWSLFRRCIDLEEHAFVWISFANCHFLETDDHDPDTVFLAAEKARQIFIEANQSMRKMDDSQRQLLLNHWKKFEQDYGSKDNLELVLSKFPRKINDRRRVDNDDGTSSWQEVVVLVYPDDLQEKENQSVVDEFMDFLNTEY